MLEAEEGQTVATEEVADTTNAGTTTAPDFVSVDGTLSKDWTNTLDADLRGDKTLRVFKNVKDLAKSYVSARQMIGKEKIAIPTEKSTPAEWEEYYKAGGRPETVADYKLDYPKDMPVPEVPELRKAYMELAYKTGMSQKQTAAAYEFYNGLVKAAMVEQQQQEELQLKESQERLHTEWGKAYEQRIHFGNVAIEQATAGNEGLKERVVEKFGNDTDFIQFASNLGDKFAEHRTISQNIPTPSDIQTRINELMQQPVYMNRDMPGHKQAVELVQKLFAEKAKGQGR